jgi:hypothetical protein
MAFGDVFQVKTVLGATDLVLDASPGEAFLIYDVAVLNSVGNYATLSVDKAKVGYFRVRADGLGNHLHGMIQDKEKRSLLGTLIAGGLFRPIPVPQGSKFQITGVNQATSIQSVVYRKVAPGSVRLDQANGPLSKEYDIILYGQPSAAPVAGTTELDLANNPTEFTKFPFSENVPPGTIISIFGVLFSDVGKTSGTAANKQYTTYLKLGVGRVTLFDEDLNGVPFVGAAPAADGTDIGLGFSFGGNFSTIDQRYPLMFPEPLVFTEGADLDISVTTVVGLGVANFAAADVEVGLIARVKES